MSRLLLAALLCLGYAGQALAQAEPVATLIAEKATADTGAAMPPGGRFQVSLETPEPRQAEMVSAFSMDPRSGQFAANVVTAAGELRRVYGLAVLTVPVPVPTHQILPGEQIGPDDLRTVPVAYAQLDAYAITDPARLEGMEARQTLAAGRPVQQQSVTAPLAINRGDRVSIQFVSGRLSLSAPGRAISSAQADQEVRVINLASNRTIVGIARPGRIVEVTR